jgi:hypothetical protein
LSCPISAPFLAPHERPFQFNRDAEPCAAANCSGRHSLRSRPQTCPSHLSAQAAPPSAVAELGVVRRLRTSPAERARRYIHRMTRTNANDHPTCPRCRSSAGFHPIQIQEDSGTGCLMFFLGGFIPYLIYDSSRSGRVQCESCGFVFRPPQRLLNGTSHSCSSFSLPSLQRLCISSSLPAADDSCYSGIHRESGRCSRNSFRASVLNPTSPNHALQRTAPGVTACAPSRRPAPAAFPHRLRRLPESPSLGSLGDATRAPMKP